MLQARHPAAQQALTDNPAAVTGLGETPTTEPRQPAPCDPRGASCPAAAGTDAALGKPFAIKTMQKLHKTLHPIEALLLVSWLALEAVFTLARAVLVPVVALVLTVARWRPPPPPITHTDEAESLDRVMTTAVPLIHPLALVAADLQQLTRRELQAIAGIRTNLPKTTLAGLVIVPFGGSPPPRGLTACS